MKLIINADDFGLSEGITYGIYDAVKRGVVTSTTMMVNMRASALAGEIVKRDDSLSVGLHLNLSFGKPLTDCFSLTCEGRFVKPKNCDIHDQFTDEDLDKELDAQYKKFCELTGKKPTHIDSHLYMHQIYDMSGFFEYLKKENYFDNDMATLNGDKSRYEHFGFSKVIESYAYKFSVSKNLSAVKCERAEAKDGELLYDIYRKYNIGVCRLKENFSDVLKTNGNTVLKLHLNDKYSYAVYDEKNAAVLECYGDIDFYEVLNSIGQSYNQTSIYAEAPYNCHDSRLAKNAKGYSGAAQIYFRKPLTATEQSTLISALSNITGVANVYNRTQLDQMNTPKNLGDLVVDCDVGYAFSTSAAEHGSYAQRHTILFFSGRGIKSGFSYSPVCRTVDIVPTIYYLNGLVSPATVDGNVLTSILTD